MSRSLPLGLALAAALSLAACGDSNPELIPEQRAERLTATVDRIAQRTSDEDCEGAEEALRSARNQVAELPRRVDRALKANIDEWLDQIASRIPQDCKPAEEEETPTATPEETETPSPTPEETETPSPTPTATEPPPDEGGDEGQSPEGEPPVQLPESGGVSPEGG